MAKIENKPEVLETETATPVSKPAGFEFHKLNTLAVVSLASALTWVGAIGAIVTGHISLAQIKQTHERGRVLAIIGLVLGYVYLVGGLVAGVLMVLLRLRGWHLGHEGGFGYGRDDFGNGQMGPGMMNQWSNN
jgi:MFS family permease